MLPSEIIRRRRNDILNVLARYPTLSNLRLCGSVARGDESEGSDVDFLVDHGPEATLFDLGGLREDLEELLGIPVDLISSKSRIEPSMKQSMFNEAIPV